MKVTLSKKQAITEITENRALHRDIFLEAQEGYKKAVIAELEERIDRAKRGKPLDRYLVAMPPEDHTSDYDRILHMLERHEGNSIEFSEGDYQQYIMDDWAWKRQWLVSNKAYSVTAAAMMEDVSDDE